MFAKFKILFIIVFIYVVPVSNLKLEDTSKQTHLYENSMDMSYCNSLYLLLRFFYESPRGIFRNTFEMNEVLTPAATSEMMLDSNTLCGGSGRAYTNPKKIEYNKFNVVIYRNFQWKNRVESQTYSNKFKVSVECKGNIAMRDHFRNMLEETDLDLDVGKFEIASNMSSSSGGDLVFIMKQYKD